MMKTRTKAIAALTGAALALTSAGTLPGYAASRPQASAQSAAPATDISARKRYHRGSRNNAAAAAAFGAIVSGIAAYAAAREYRKARERS